MIIKKIVLENFRQFYDKQEINFNHDAEKNVTIILGNNGAGKTTLNQAFIFCLFGLKEVRFNDIAQKIYDGDKKSIRLLCNNRAYNTASDTSGFNVGVTVVFEHNGFEYTATRKYKCFKPMAMTQYTFSSEEFNGKRITIGDSDTQESTKPFTEYDLRSILPPALSPIFFFDGERMEDLVTEKQKTILAESVISILDLSAFRKTLRYLKMNNHPSIHSTNKTTVESLINRDLVKKSTGADFAELKEKKQYEIIEIEIEKAELHGQLTKARNRKGEILEEIKSLAANKKDQELRETLEKSNKQILTSIDGSEKTIFTLFGEKFIGVLSDEYSELLNNVIETNVFKDRGIKGINSSAIDSILERGKCLCGAVLEENSPQKKNLIEWKDFLPPNDLSSLFNTIKDDIIQRKTEKEKFLEQFSFSKKQIVQYKEAYMENEDKIKSIVINNSLIEEIGGLERELSNTTSEISKNERRIEQLEYKRQSVEREIADLQTKIDEEITNDEKNAKVKNKLDLLTKVYDRIEYSAEKREKEAKELLERYAVENYREIEQKNYILTLNTNYSFDIYNNSNTVITNSLSEGEKVVASFAFIGALIKVAMEQNKTLIENGKQFYPMVMDAPFAKLDVEHRRNVALRLPSFSKQVIIFTTDSQFEGTIKQNMIDKVSNIYELKFDKENEITRIEKIGG